MTNNIIESVSYSKDDQYRWLHFDLNDIYVEVGGDRFGGVIILQPYYPSPDDFSIMLFNKGSQNVRSWSMSPEFFGILQAIAKTISFIKDNAVER